MSSGRPASSPAHQMLPLWLVAGSVAGSLLASGCGASSVGSTVTARSPQSAASTPSTQRRQVIPALGGGESVLFPNDPPEAIAVAAGAGRVVAIQGAAHGSNLLDITAPGRPRTLAHLDGAVGFPSVGTGAAGGPVVVYSPCTPSGPDQHKSCNLDSLNLETGGRTTLAATRGARLGDMDRGRLVVVRRSKVGEDRLSVSTAAGSTTFTALPLTTIRRRGSTKAYPVTPGGAVTGIDFARGQLAATISSSSSTGGSSKLLVRNLRGPWTELAQTSYGQLDGVSREFWAPTGTATGIRAFDDGGAEVNPSLGRWSVTGGALARIGVKRKFGIDGSAAIDGDLLITVSDEDTSLGAAGGPVLQSGPYRLG